MWHHQEGAPVLVLVVAHFFIDTVIYTHSSREENICISSTFVARNPTHTIIVKDNKEFSVRHASPLNGKTLMF